MIDCGTTQQCLSNSIVFERSCTVKCKVADFLKIEYLKCSCRAIRKTKRG